MAKADKNEEVMEPFILQTGKLCPRMEKFLQQVTAQLGHETGSHDSQDKVIATASC